MRMLNRSSIRLAVRAKAWKPTQEDWILAAQCIQPEEKERIGRFVFQRDAKAGIVGRLLIRRVVSAMLGIDFKDLKLARTDKGKPYVLNTSEGTLGRKGCHFNISHQGDFVIIAVEEHRQVGVDVMKVEWPRATNVQDFFKLLERHLTEQEWNAVNASNDDMTKLQVFFRIWCLKESVVKTIGTGVGLEFSRLDFSLGGGELTEGEITHTTTVKVDKESAPDWRFEETMLEGHVLTVATLPSEKQPAEADVKEEEPMDEDGQGFTVWTVDQLLKNCVPLPGATPDQAYWENFAAKAEEPKIKGSEEKNNAESGEEREGEGEEDEDTEIEGEDEEEGEGEEDEEEEIEEDEPEGEDEDTEEEGK